MTDIAVGKYAGGLLGSTYDVNADKNALKGNQKASDAVNTAKANSGAEVTVIDGAGNATVHTLKVEKGTFTKPKATASGFITVDNLAAPNAKVDKTKPLAIDPGIAGKLGGDVAVLVDEKNNVSVIGNKTAATDNFLNAPTAQKVDAAYVTAGDDNYVNKKMASNVSNKLTANYRNTGEASHDIGLLKDGQVKTVMNNLIADLNTISANTSDLETQRKNRENKFNGDIVKPQQRLDSANKAWNSANDSEMAKVNDASENLREAKFPGVHETEGALAKAKNMVADGKGYLQNAANQVSNAAAEVNRLETLKTNTTNLSNATQDLGMVNRKIELDMANYLVNRKDQLSTLRSTLNDKAQYYQSLADTESRKPAAPAQPSGGNSATQDPFANKPSGGNGGSSVNSDPFANKPANNGGNSATQDPFANKPGSKPTGNSATSDPFSGKPNSGGNSATQDPFANKPSGGNGGNSVTSDPFSNGGSGSNVQYRNEGLINEYKTKASETRDDAMSLDFRIKTLNSVISQARVGGIESNSFRNAVNSMGDSYSYKSSNYYKDNGSNYLNGENGDKAVIINNFIRPYDDNTRTINSNNQTIRNNVAEYKNKIDGANQRLSEAKVNESQAAGNLEGAQARVTQIAGELDRINSKPPVADSAPSVKSAKSALDSAQKHMDNTVGDNAPLTKEKNAAQSDVDSIKASHTNDIKALNDKITDNANSAQQKINTTKRSLGI